MHLLLSTIFTTPCTLDSGYQLELADARAMAASFGVPTPVATIPDAMFDMDHPIVISVLPPKQRTWHPALIITTSHTEALALNSGAPGVIDAQMLEVLSITWRGLVLGGGSCDARLAQAQTALDAMTHGG